MLPIIRWPNVIPFIFSVLFLTVICSNADTSSFIRHTRVIRGNGTSGPYVLEEALIGGTIAVEASSIDPPPQIADWDPSGGTVTFIRPIAESDSIIITYAVPPDWVQRTYARDPLKAPGDSYRPYEKDPHAQAPTVRGLTFGGSKTFDVNIGSDRNVGINQTLRLNISGKLTDDITMNAAVSDQNVPITPEGNTRELSELDRVLIQIRGPHFAAEMGDTELDRSVGRWQRYHRRLSGAELRVSAKGVDVFGSGAVSEGRYRSIVISPVEGNQGPYRLTADDGSTTITIVPGTERVWINGVALTRGNNYDYVIDYDTAELSFTENRIIGSDMRIVVDYEYTSESYRRNFYAGGADASLLDGRLTLGVLGVKESDDPDKPVFTDLDDEAKKILREAGDAGAAIPGIFTAEDDTSGTYDMVYEHLVYNPAHNGAYRATFSWIGEDEGTYRYKGGGIYEWVPPDDRVPGSGASYDSVAFIPGPVSHTMTGLTMTAKPLVNLAIDAEVAGSVVDRNTLSPMDDSDNDGFAQQYGASFTPEINAGIPVRLEFGGTKRLRDGRFQPLDRDRSAEENREWGLPLIMEAADEDIQELRTGFTLGEGRFKDSGVSIFNGAASWGDSTESSRAGGEATLHLGEALDQSLRLNMITRESYPGLPDEDITRVDARTRSAVRGFGPWMNYEGERTEGRGLAPHATAYDDIRTGVSTPAWRGVTGAADILYRSERTRHTSWRDSSTVKGAALEMTVGQGVNGSLRTRYAHRRRSGDTGGNTSDQGLIEGFYRPEDGSWSIDWSYRAGRSREASKRRTYIYAGPGRGSYRWEDENEDGVRDPDEFIPDEKGSYYPYEETLDDYRPVNEVALFTRFGADVPSGWVQRIGGKGLTVHSETSVEINEQSTAEASDVFLLRLDRFRKEGLTTSGDSRIQQDFTMPVGNEGSLRLRFYRFDVYDAEYVTGAERRSTNEESVRLRNPIGDNADLESNLSYSHFTRTMDEAPAGDYDVGSLYGTTELSYHPAFSSTLALEGGLGRDTDDVTGIKAAYFTVKPRYIYRFSGKGKLETAYTITSVTLSNYTAGTRLPHTLARGRKEGDNHDVTVSYDYRLSERMNLVVTYTGRKFADRDFENFGRAQVRALF